MFTTLCKAIACPLLNEEITLTAKYRFTDNPDNKYEVKFSYATCPVVENSKLKPYEQREEYKYLRCTFSHCPHLSSFPTLWDARNPL